jgi:hypothetical protein
MSNPILPTFRALRSLSLFNGLRLRLVMYKWIESNPEGLEAIKQLVAECNEGEKR